MLPEILFAAGLDGMFRPDRLLAVVVAALAAVVCAFLGSFVFGMLTRVLSRALTLKASPRSLVFGFRIVGAALFGVAAFLYVMTFFGGPGPGGSGGWGFGTGQSGTGESAGKDTVKDGKDRGLGKGEAASSVLYVEVLLNQEIEAVAGDPAVEAQKYYRLEGAPRNDLLTLPELKDRIRSRQPPVKVLYIVLSPDSPDRDVGRVVDLRTWATREGLKISYASPDRGGTRS